MYSSLWIRTFTPKYVLQGGYVYFNWLLLIRWSAVYKFVTALLVTVQLQLRSRASERNNQAIKHTFCQSKNLKKIGRKRFYRWHVTQSNQLVFLSLSITKLNYYSKCERQRNEAVLSWLLIFSSLEITLILGSLPPKGLWSLDSIWSRSQTLLHRTYIMWLLLGMGNYLGCIQAGETVVMRGYGRLEAAA